MAVQIKAYNAIHVVPIVCSAQSMQGAGETLAHSWDIVGQINTVL